MASKAHVVGTFDKLAEATGESLLNADGCRRFGGHTPRVTGARHYATHGVEINKIRLIARHSGETIMRYVLDAPLQSIRADLGLSPQGTKLMPYASTQCKGHPDMAAKVLALEAALDRMDAQLLQLEADKVKMQADIIAASKVKPSYVQNTDTAAVHLIRPTDECRTMCGYEFRGPTFRKRRSGKPDLCFRFFDTLKDIPGSLMCSRCLPSERAMGIARDLLEAEISADEPGDG